MTQSNKDIILSRIESLCAEKKITPTTAFVESGVGKNFKCNFKNANPSDGKLTMLANYFDVTLAYIKGETDERKPSPLSPLFTLTDQELALIEAYRSRPEMQPAVDKLLGIESEEYVQVYMAARSDEKRPDKIIAVSKQFIEKAENAPETDDPLR